MQYQRLIEDYLTNGYTIEEAIAMADEAYQELYADHLAND